MHRTLTGWEGRVKRFADVCGAGAGLILASPLMLAIALAIKLSDRGDVFHKQKRVGLHGTVFTMWKFRTMRQNAEARTGPVWSVSNDPRCTPLGVWLRRLGFDELPQLWNVVRGEMSLIGPRPERPLFVRQFRRDFRNYDARHSVRVGITGYAQAHGWRGDTSLSARLNHDLYYVQHWSLLLDLRVLFLTIAFGWSQRTRNALQNAPARTTARGRATVKAFTHK